MNSDIYTHKHPVTFRYTRYLKKSMLIYSCLQQLTPFSTVDWLNLLVLKNNQLNKSFWFCFWSFAFASCQHQNGLNFSQHLNRTFSRAFSVRKIECDGTSDLLNNDEHDKIKPPNRLKNSQCLFLFFFDSDSKTAFIHWHFGYRFLRKSDYRKFFQLVCA